MLAGDRADEESMKRPYRDDAPRTTLRDFRPILLRVGGALSVALGFLVVTSQIDPADSNADLGAISAPGSVGAVGANSEGLSLGSLQGREYSVHMVATPDGPRYSVTNRAGVMVGQNLTKSEVYDLVPGLDLETLSAGPVMMLFDND